MISSPTVARQSTEVVVLLTLEFEPKSVRDILAVIRPNIERTRAEVGNLEFQMFAVNETASTFVIFERWESQAALDDHWRMPYMTDVFDVFDRHLLQPLSDGDNVLHLTDVVGNAKPQ